MFFKNKKQAEAKTLKKVRLNQSYFLELKQFEIEKSSDAGKKLSLVIYDNRVKGKKYHGEKEAEIEFKTTEMGLIYSNVSDELLLSLAPELSNYEGVFFGQKIILDFDGKKERRYPVFFSVYRKNFLNGKEERSHITGFAYLSEEAVISNQAVSIQKV